MHKILKCVCICNFQQLAHVISICIHFWLLKRLCNTFPTLPKHFSCWQATTPVPCWSVLKSVLNFKWFLHYCSCPTVRDWIAVYLALFLFIRFKSQCKQRQNLMSQHIFWTIFNIIKWLFFEQKIDLFIILKIFLHER